MFKILSLVLIIAALAAVGILYWQNVDQVENGPIACTMDAKLCPDGSAVGRTGPNCEFAECPKMPEVESGLQQHIDEKANLIRLESPQPYGVITSPLSITGEARGYWFFEASFPVGLVNWDGVIIAEGIATADGEWMTEDFVLFNAELEFETNFATDTPDFMKKGTLILKKDNPSGLPQNDDALEIPIVFQ